MGEYLHCGILHSFPCPTNWVGSANFMDRPAAHAAQLNAGALKAMEILESLPTSRATSSYCNSDKVRQMPMMKRTDQTLNRSAVHEITLAHYKLVHLQ